MLSKRLQPPVLAGRRQSLNPGIPRLEPGNEKNEKTIDYLP